MTVTALSPVNSIRAHQRRLREARPDAMEAATEGYEPLGVAGGFTFGRVPRPDARRFIARYEWLGHAGRACTFFGLWREGALYGVVGFNHPTYWLMRQLGRDLAQRTRILSRGACVLAAGRNAASALIGASLRELKRQNIALVVAYADERAGELGTIYKAANLRFAGWTSGHPQYQLLVGGKWRQAGELFRRHKATRYTQLPPEVVVDDIRREAEPKRRFVRVLAKGVTLPPSWSVIARPATSKRRYEASQTSRARRAQQLAVNLPPARTPGRPPNGGNNPDNVRVSGGGYGNSARYRVARLKRDHPDIAAKLARGEYRSVAAAWRDAKRPPPPACVRAPREILPPWREVAGESTEVG